MFPFDHRGEFIRSKSTIVDAPDFAHDFEARATRALNSCRARNIVVANGRISFTAGIFRFVTRLNILNSIGYGQILLTETPDHFVASYYISFRQMAVVLALIDIVFCAFVFGNDRGNEIPLIAKLAIPVIAWLVLLAFNWLGALIQFPTLVKSMLWGGGRTEQIVEPERRKRLSHLA
jgi:hypothetical protein